MPVTPEKDKAAFYKRIREDPYILRKMGLETATENQIRKQIITRKMYDGTLDAKSRYICIYHTPSRKAQNSSYIEDVMQVDVLVASGISNTADDICEQIIALLTCDDFIVNGKPVSLDASAGDLAPPSGFYSTGYRFSYFSSVENTIKTL